MTDLTRKMKDLVERTVSNTEWRQRRCINLIPSENTPSLLVRLLEITDPSGRYAEHRRMNREETYFYQGIDFIARIEEEVKAELGRYFGCEEIEIRPISGQMANMVVFQGMLKLINRETPKGAPLRRMRAVVNNGLMAGGHLSSQPMGALFNCIDMNPASGEENAINFPVRNDNPYRTDPELLFDVLTEAKPDLVIFGKSLFLFPEPVAAVRELVDQWEDPPVIMYDMSHPLGLYGAFQAPIQEGADLVTGSTHKTFPGTQRGVVAANLPKEHRSCKLWPLIRNRAFPGFTSNHHLGTLIGLLGATYEMNAFKDEYQFQVRSNAKAFAHALHSQGITVEGEIDGFTETHQVVIRVGQYGTGQELARRLEENNIVTNYQALPDDPNFLESSGIRMGVQEMTRFGMDEAGFEQVAIMLSDCLKTGRDVSGDIGELRRNYQEMRYCLPAEETATLAAQLIEAILPHDDTRSEFLKALRR